MNENKIKEKTPAESLEFESQEFLVENRKTGSENSDRGFLESINDAQQSIEAQMLEIPA